MIKKDILAISIIVIISCVIYFNSLQNDFVFDDLPLLVNNNLTYGIKNIPKILGINFDQQMNLKLTLPYPRPIRFISYAIDYSIAGLNPNIYHVSNVFYHIITASLVYLIAKLLSKKFRIALLTGILFTVHPVQTAAVTYISGRRDILFALFYLMGFYFFLKYRNGPRKIYIVFGSLAYILAIFSKEMAVTLPVVLLCYDFCNNFQIANNHLNFAFLKKIYLTLKQVIVKYKYLYLAAFLGAISFAFYTVFIKTVTLKNEFYGGNIYLNCLTVGKILIFYIKLLFCPLRLNADYSYNVFPIAQSFFELQTFFSVIALIIICYGILISMQHSKVLAFCGFWFFASLIPAYHIIPHHELLAEHYLYLASFAFCLFLSLLLEKIFVLQKYKRLALCLYITLIILFSYRVIDRNKDWRNSITLWKKTVQTAPKSVRAHNNLGLEYSKRNWDDLAIAEFKAALKIRPDSVEVHSNLGIAYYKKGWIGQAIVEYKKALSLEPDFVEAHNNLGVVYYEQGLIDQAIAEYKESLSLEPDSAEAHNALGFFYYKKGWIEQAQTEFKEALRLKPNYIKAQNNLQVIYNKK